jgi:hypothetical protein
LLNVLIESFFLYYTKHNGINISLKKEIKTDFKNDFDYIFYLLEWSMT